GGRLPRALPGEASTARRHPPRGGGVPRRRLLRRRCHPRPSGCLARPRRGGARGPGLVRRDRGVRLLALRRDRRGGPQRLPGADLPLYRPARDGLVAAVLGLAGLARLGLSPSVLLRLGARVGAEAVLAPPGDAGLVGAARG